MSMAPHELLLCFAILFHQSASEAFVTVRCKPGNLGQYGQPSVVECVVERSEEAKDAKLTTVYWMKEDRLQKREKLLVFEEGNVQPTPRYAFADPSWNEKNMNVSLLISSTVISDSGDYKCLVITESGHAHGLTNLSVRANYERPKITEEKSPVNEHSTLVCSSEGGFPQAELNWYDVNGNKVVGEREAKQAENGLYTLINKLTVKQGSGTYTCKVVSASGGEAENFHGLETLFPEKPKPETLEGGEPKLSPAQIVAPLVVIGSLIVGLLLLILYKKRRTQARRPSAAPLMGPNEPAEVNTSYSPPDQYDSEDETRQTADNDM